jgi:hypothetical protein
MHRQERRKLLRENKFRKGGVGTACLLLQQRAHQVNSTKGLFNQKPFEFFQDWG